MAADPAIVGQRVLAALAAGRQRAIDRARERGAITATLVRRALDVDILEGRPPWGRAGRISRSLRRRGVVVSDRRVREILLALLSSPADSE